MNFLEQIQAYQTEYSDEVMSNLKVFTEVRKDSLKKLFEKGLPERTEEWKYTSLRALNDFDLSSKSDVVVSKNLFESYVVAKNYLVVVDGVFSSLLSDYSELVSVEVKNKATANGSSPKIGSVTKSEDVFTEINSSLLVDFLYIKTASSVNQTLQIINISTAGFSTPRVFVDLEAGANLNLVDSYLSFGENKKFICPVAEYQVAENSQLTVTKLVESNDCFHIANQEAEVQGSGNFYSHTYNLTNYITRNNLQVRLLGENAYVAMLGLSALDANEHVDNYTEIDHQAPHCDSFELYKNILADKSSAVFNGTITVRPDAQKTNAIQSNQALLLSEEAKNYAKPQLKIWADDVKCTHGATCGTFDNDALFYLMARGIDRKSAEKMLVAAFVGEVTEHLQDQRIKEYLQGKLDQKI